MSSLAIVGGLLHLADRGDPAAAGRRPPLDPDLRGGDVEIEGDRIVALPHNGGAGGDVVLDARGCSVLPGFVDLQVNGAVGVDLTSQPERIAEIAAFLPRCGVTSFMPTIISSSVEDTASSIASISAWSRQAEPGRDGARPLGLHLEGPFLQPARAGAHPLQHLRAPSLAEARDWSRASGVAMVTLAPELDGAVELICELVARDVVVCAGHTQADAGQMFRARRAGALGATHLYNAMGAMSARSPGPAGAVLSDDILIAGLIVDGIHVDRDMVRLAWRVLGPERFALVSDAMSALGFADGVYAIGDTQVMVGPTGARTPTGVLAGSVLRFDDAVRNLMQMTYCTLQDASRSASGTPARLARRADIGRLAVGLRGDVVVLDSGHRVVATVVGGQVVHDPEARASTRRTR